MIFFYHGHDPQHPHHADAKADNGRGTHGIPHAPHGAREDLHRHERGRKGHNDKNDVRAGFNDGGIRGVDSQNDPAKYRHQQADDPHRADAHGQAHPDALAHPVVAMGTVILAHKGGDGYAKGTGDHPGQSVGLRIGGPGRHNRGAEGIDAGLDQGIGQVKHHSWRPAGTPMARILPRSLG